MPLLQYNELIYITIKRTQFDKLKEKNYAQTYNYPVPFLLLSVLLLLFVVDGGGVFSKKLLWFIDQAIRLTYNKLSSHEIHVIIIIKGLYSLGIIEINGIVSKQKLILGF